MAPRGGGSTFRHGLVVHPLAERVVTKLDHGPRSICAPGLFVSRACDFSSSHNQPCPQYEVRVPISEVRAPRGWTPVDRSKPKPPPAPKTRATPVGERARRWQRLMDEGRYPKMSELARAEGVTPAAVSKALSRLLQRQADDSLGHV